MMKHGLYECEFEIMLRNPYKVFWHLKQPASQKFYIDLHNLLLKKRIPAEEIGTIYRQIDERINKTTSGNNAIINKNFTWPLYRR